MKLKLSNLAYFIGLSFIYLPLIILVIYSFNNSKIITIWGGFSVKWYKYIIKDYELIEAFINSIEIASISATLSIILGTLTSLIITRSNIKGVQLLSAISSIPFVMPEIIIGMSLLLLYVVLNKLLSWPKIFGMHTIVIAHTTVGMSYVILLLNARLFNMDKKLEEAAQDLGATPLRAFITITLPIIIPTLISGWVLSFTISLDDLVIATFTSGPSNNTLPMLIYSRVKLGISPEINVLATIFLAIISIISIILAIIAYRKRNFNNY